MGVERAASSTEAVQGGINMSIENFVRQVQAALQSGQEGSLLLEKGLKEALSVAADAARETKVRSERIKKERARGARGTTHRISL